MIEHTPGPWAVGEPSGHCTNWIKVQEGVFGVAMVFTRHPSGADTTPFPEGEANARLIALSPELLAFVEGVARGAYRDSDLQSLMETYRVRAGVLCAKAKGAEDE